MPSRNNMDVSPHHHRLLSCVVLLLLCAVQTHSRASQISDLQSKLSGVEELLEDFRKQLQQQDQAGYASREGGGVMDGCLGDFTGLGEHIIRAKDSIEQGATFLLVPGRVDSWEDCLHACCSEPHCTVAVVQEDLGRPGESHHCYLFNCTYRQKNVCSFAPQPGFSTHSRANSTGGHLLSMSPRNQLPSPARRPAASLADDDTQELDEPPRGDAGQDVVIQLPTDWAVLDGRDSLDDHGISHYDWALVKGDANINMKVTHAGLLKVSGLQHGVYTFQMTVTDTAGQHSSDNVSVTVLAPEHQAEVCTGHCSRYQFMCDDGCCIDISYACDGKQQCPDRSDEAFCQNFDSSRKTVTHPSPHRLVVQAEEAENSPHRLVVQAQEAEKSPHRLVVQEEEAENSPHRLVVQAEEAEEASLLQAGPRKSLESIIPPPAVPHHSTKLPLPPPAHPLSPSQQEEPVSPDPCATAPVVGPCKGTFARWYYDQEAGRCKHFLYGGCQGNHNNFLQEADCVSECIQKSPAFKPATVAPPITKQTEIAAPKEPVSQNRPENRLPISNPFPVKVPESGGHPVPESGAILPLALGLIITALLLLMISCRLRLVRHKLKKTRPLTTEESDYLINGMYL